MKSSSRVNLTTRLTINQDRVGHRTDVGTNQSYPFSIEAHSFHQLFKEDPFYPVVGLAHIQLKSYKPYFPLVLILQIMEGLNNN